MRPLFTKTEETKRFYSYDRKKNHIDNVEVKTPKVYIDFDAKKKEWVATVDGRVCDRDSELYSLAFKCKRKGLIKQSTFDSIINGLYDV